MSAKVTRLDSKRDIEAIEWAKELRETESWFQSQRFRQITRLHTAYEVVALRGNAREDHAIAKQAAIKMYDTLQRLFKEKKQEITYGPFSPTGAVRAVMEGIKILYLGGWSTSARGSDSEDPGADLANYALDRVPKEGASWVRALLHQDEVQRSNRMRMTSAPVTEASITFATWLRNSWKTRSAPFTLKTKDRGARFADIRVKRFWSLRLK